ncbi:hypothetical protein [Gimesia algae]|uniref:Uncharacterized protein n=1 Tax=Gimesia algae TaxID=2527971 RepID=A0A517VHZ8_9PLAN|nr:hypothetical protein [Gimesia algae]QDT92639.1 hypothetical protein Pan161_43070 [Gimesia algae]
MRRFSLLIISVLILCLLLFLMTSEHDQNSFNQALNQTYQLIMPPDSNATVPGVTETEWSRTAEWTIETNLTWKAYRDWLLNQLGGTYRILSETENQIELRKTFHSEIHDIKLITDEVEGKVHAVYSISLW